MRYLTEEEKKQYMIGDRKIVDFGGKRTHNLIVSVGPDFQPIWIEEPRGFATKENISKFLNYGKKPYELVDKQIY